MGGRSDLFESSSGGRDFCFRRSPECRTIRTQVLDPHGERLAMDCDEAFQLMTDPRGAQSPALQWHLQGCPRCRQMLETLAPALKYESIPPREGDSATIKPNWSAAAMSETLPLPLESPGLVPPAVPFADQPLAGVPGMRFYRWQRLINAISLVLFGAVLGMAALLWQRTTAEERAAESTQPIAIPPGPCTWRNRELDPPPMTRSARMVIQSCTRCHVSKD